MSGHKSKSRNGGTWGGSAEHCINVDWPAAYTWSARQYRRGYSGPVSWMGSLIYESRDASGLYYRRNRYYDSENGRFTQEDPIGLGGGMNAYGFAGGDPISYHDPYGLCPEIPGTTAPCSFFAVVMGEARGASKDFQVAVASVIRNRAMKVGGDYDRVIWAPNQFTSTNLSDSNNGVVQATIFDGTVTPQVRDVVEGVYTGQIGDSTSGALLYYSPQSMRPANSTPPWRFGELEQTLDLGNEGKFYKCKSGTSCWQRPQKGRPAPHTSSGAYPVQEDEK